MRDLVQDKRNLHQVRTAGDRIRQYQVHDYKIEEKYPYTPASATTTTPSWISRFSQA